MTKGAFATDKTNQSPAKVLIVGVGNRLLGDEGLGPHLTDVLSGMDIPSYVDVIDCGCDLLRLARYAGRPEKIIVVDAIRAGGHLHPSQVWRIVKKSAMRAGIKKAVSPHWFRHAHASHALDRGAKISLVQSTLSHSSISTTGRYLHAKPNECSSTYLQV